MTTIAANPIAATLKVAASIDDNNNNNKINNNKNAKKINNYPQDITFLPFTETNEEEMLRLKVTKTVNLLNGDIKDKRKEILDYFHNTYTLYEKLFEPLSLKSYYMRADSLRHPLIFYYGHTAVLYVNKLRLAKIIKARINKKFESMLAVGVDEMSWDDLLEDHYDWPTVAEVKAYRDQVRAVVEEAIAKTPLKLPITWDDPFWAILMGIEHERIHLETSTVLIRQLPLEVLKTHPFWEPYRNKPTDGEAPANELLPVINKPTAFRMGKSFENDPYYGWDNEYGNYEAVIPPFKASKYLVTNKEYLEFVEDGGYFKKDYWTEEGWRWANFKNAKRACYPLFWIPKTEKVKKITTTTTTINENENKNNNKNKNKKNNKQQTKQTEQVGQEEEEFEEKTTWKLRLMLEEVDMPWDWPVETNYLEAKAFCNWKAAKTGKKIRLPMEDEYHLFREQEMKVDYPNWDKAPANINLEYYCSSTPVTMFPPSKNGFYDVLGNVWQHSETPIDPFKGFKVHKLYDDFSVPTFDLQHNMILGGSWITTGNETLNYSRYAFRRHFYQHAGFRYIESERAVVLRSDVNERDESVALYAAFHYGIEYFGVPNFPKTLAELAVKYMQGRPMKRALDMGCAVGRGSFELGRYFDYVLGLDFSARFIRLAVQLKEQGSCQYSTLEEGTLVSDHTVTIDDFKFKEIKDKCEFYQADACNLDPRYTGYDLVLAGNLLEELYEPMNFLTTIHDRVNPGGLLIIASSYGWREQFTPKDAWLGGYRDEDGKEVHTLDSLKKVLSKNFKLCGSPAEVPYVLRETKRRFQHGLSEVTVWERINK